MDFIFNQSFASSDTGHSFYDIAKDFFLPALLGLLALIATYYIFYKETKITREKEQINEFQRVKDKLTYFTALLSSIIHMAGEQNRHINKFISEINQDNLQFPLLTSVPSQDLHRLVKELNMEIYLLAFADYYNQDRKASIKKFKNIMAKADFLYNLLKSIFSQVEKGQQYDFERKQQYSDKFYSAYNLSNGFVISLNSYPAWREKFLKILDSFSSNHSGDNYDIKFYNAYFFEPINLFCMEYLEKDLPVSQDFNAIAINTRDGKQLFTNIKLHNIELANDFSEEYEKINATITQLSILCKDLIKDF